MLRKTENKITRVGEKQRLPITNDYIFKRVFAYKGNESMLKDLLEAILEINIAKVKIKNPEIIPYTKEEKRGLLDIKVELENGTNIDIEMQMKNKSNTKERSTLYLGKMISEQLLTTGSSEETNKMNIYDFAGNGREWTLEYTSISSLPCASRGGGCKNLGSSGPACDHYDVRISSSLFNICFRSALY